MDVETTPQNDVELNLPSEKESYTVKGLPQKRENIRKKRYKRNLLKL